MRVFDLIGTVDAVANYDELAGEVIAAGTLDGELTGDCLSDDVLDTVVVPRDGTVQVVDMELWIGGAFVQRRHVHAEMSVERDYDNIVQGWNFGHPLETPAGIFGTPFACIGPAIGLDEVDIYGIYDTPSGIIRIPLIRNGIVDNSHREAGEGGIFETFTGVDGGGRFDGVKITKQFPPGHGLYRGRVGREIMRSVGDDQVSFEDGNRMDKELQLVDAEPFPPLAEIFEVENRKLLKDSDGFWINPRVGRIRSEETAIFSFEERDVLRVSTVSLDSMANVITLVIANGTKQKTMEDCGLSYSTETEYEFAENYVRRRSSYLQNTDGTYDYQAPHDPTPGLTLVRKVQKQRTKFCDVLIEEVTRVWEMNRIEIPRHEYAGGSGAGIEDGWQMLSCYTDDSDGVGGGPAYQDETEVFRLVSVAQMKSFYLHENYVFDGSFLPSGDGWQQKMFLPQWAAYSTAAYLAANPGAEDNPTYGQAQGSVTFFSRMGHLSGSIKPRDISTIPYPLWEDTEPAIGQKLWGDGTGVNHEDSYLSIAANAFPILTGVDNFPREYDSLIPWSISETVYFGNEHNFLVREDAYTYEWAAKKGLAFYYSDDDKRAQESKELRLVSAVIKKNSATAPTHTEEETHIDYIERDLRVFTRTGVAGDLPAIERLDFVEPNTDIYQDGEDTELLKKARRTDTEQITVTVPFDFFLTCHVPKEVVVEFPWAENEDELRKMAEALAQESAVMPVFFTLPANFLIREAMPIHLTYRPLAIDHDIRVKAVKWKRAPEKPLLTEVEARLYGW